MDDEKERWFIGYSRRMWWPVSWQGWALMVGYFLSMSAIVGLSGHAAEESLSMREIVFLLAQIAVPTVGFYWLSRGHVDKRY